MIVIKASGAPDVKALRRLAAELSAEEVELSAEEIAPALPRRRRKPTVSTLPGASVSPQTRDAIMGLMPGEAEMAGDYIRE